MAQVTERKGPGRPPGRTAQGHATRQALHDAAIDLIAERGYEQATMRDIATRAGVSPGLLYKYFPGKQAVVLELYDTLSQRYAEASLKMRPGSWRERALFAMKASLAVLGPHRDVLVALTPVLVGDPEQGLFATSTAGSRQRVQGVFLTAVAEASETLGRKEAESLGRILYVIHLAVILWWLLDKSPEQRATSRLLKLLTRLGAVVGLASRLPGAKGVMRAVDGVIVDGLLGDGTAAPA
ncbi:MAG: TetR/AcrR family transcriptional regulator [Acidobacteriota bacterium]